jgi:hypothetical protein
MSDYPEQEPRGIDARDVRPGDMIWNPYGGPRGHAEVTSEPRERPDGTIEFDCADGRTGHFGPQFRLRLDRAAMARRDADAQRSAAEQPALQRKVSPVGELPGYPAGFMRTGGLQRLAEHQPQADPEPG